MMFALKKFLIFCISSVLSVIMISCNDDNNPSISDENGIPYLTKKIFKYELLSTAPLYKQSNMLTKYGDDLYRFGTDLPVQVFNLQTKTWRDEIIPDFSYSRWDGAAVSVDDKIFIIASISTTAGPFDILKYDPTNNTYTNTGLTLPFGFDYPAYCKNNQMIYFLSMETDSVYKFDTNDNSLKYVADNPFYSEDFYWVFSSGKYENYFYIFGSQSYIDGENLFYKLNLNNYAMEEITIPDEIKNELLVGSVIEGDLILFSDSSYSYIFNFNESSWSLDTTNCPIDIGEWSFTSDGSSLFATEVWSKELWEIKVLTIK